MEIEKKNFNNKIFIFLQLKLKFGNAKALAEDFKDY